MNGNKQESKNLTQFGDNTPTLEATKP